MLNDNLENANTNLRYSNLVHIKMTTAKEFIMI